MSMISLCLLLSGPAAADPTGPEIARQIAENSAGYGDMVASVEMVLTTDKGKESRRALKLSMLERPEADAGDYTLLVFESPADVSGTALLSHPGVGQADKQWLYLPALKRSQRISGGGQSGAFVGSEFAYEDITGATVDKHSWTLETTEPCGEGSCYRLRTEPGYEGSGYSHRLVWVTTDDLLPRKIEFYDHSGDLLKTLTYGDYQQHDGAHWRAGTWEMVNHQTGRATTLRCEEMDFGSGLKDADFAPSVLR